MPTYKYLIAYLGQDKYRDYKPNDRFIIDPTDPFDVQDWDYEKLAGIGTKSANEKTNHYMDIPGQKLYSILETAGGHFRMVTEEASTPEMCSTGGTEYVPIIDKKLNRLIYYHAPRATFEQEKEEVLEYLSAQKL